VAASREVPLSLAPFRDFEPLERARGDAPLALARVPDDAPRCRALVLVRVRVFEPPDRARDPLGDDFR
jgi:hypothetical protein